MSCKKGYDAERWKRDVREERIPRCGDERCGGVVKPDVVLFGEQVGGFPHSDPKDMRKLM